MTNNNASPVQLPLDLGHRNALGREDFMIAPSNAAAVGWIDRWPNWPAPALIIYGPPACGKSHIGTVWLSRSQDHGGRLIDDVETMIGDKDKEELLFHLYNSAKEDGYSLLLTAGQAPHLWHFTLPDLASRLKAAPAVEVHPPDDSLLAAMLIKLFHDRQLSLSEETLKYILPRIERSYDAARNLVARADHAALSDKRAVTIPLLAKLLD